MDDAQPDIPSSRRAEQIDRIQRFMRKAIIDTAVQQQLDQGSSTPIWLTPSPEHQTDTPTDSHTA